MRGYKISAAAAGIGMMILILDSKTALEYAASGIQMCVRRLIPSLFPFLFLSVILVSGLRNSSFSLLNLLERLCRVGPGAGAILLSGFLGGYPVGARGVKQAYEEGSLSRIQAERMLGFCNNCGPSFLFGVVGAFFPDSVWVWLLWMLHVTSAILTGILLPGSGSSSGIRKKSTVSVTQALESAVRTMGLICGWVVLFRVLIGFCERWFFRYLPDSFGVLVSGLLELSNGCLMLDRIQDPALRFLLAGVMLTAGGLCVSMQTAALCSGLRVRWYYLGKAIQTGIFLLLACHMILIPRYGFSGAAGFLLVDCVLGIWYVSGLKKEKISSISDCAGV